MKLKKIMKVTISGILIVGAAYAVWQAAKTTDSAENEEEKISSKIEGCKNAKEYEYTIRFRNGVTCRLNTPSEIPIQIQKRIGKIVPDGRVPQRLIDTLSSYGVAINEFHLYTDWR